MITTVNIGDANIAKNELQEVQEWARKQLKTLVKIPAVRVDGEEVKPNATALLTLKMANEYKKLISEESKTDSDEELLQILKGE